MTQQYKQFTLTLAWGDINRHKYVDNMKRQGYYVHRWWEPSIIGEPHIVVMRKDIEGR